MDNNSDVRNELYSPNSHNKTGDIREKLSEFLKIMGAPAISTFVKGILAGIIISLGATAYISLNKEIFSPFIFALSFVAVFAFGYYIFGYRVSASVFQNRLQNALLLPVLLGNLVGAVATGLLLQATRLFEGLSKNAIAIIGGHLSDGYGGVFVLAVFGGILIFIAGDAYKNLKSSGARYLVAIFAIMALMYCRFEFGLINAFYYTLTGSWGLAVIWRYILTLAGNAVGAIVIPVFGIILASNKKSSDK